ncbi:COQ9 family protein [Altericroceibacterium spongiae]|uniref:COQ9 family protein n=1 Tax=Altericroceibacterium spongiae TaxID=2320269 RepID=A0A420EJE6_9SPHN|nr:COQ9 family protein [Altericroceibacterium spongiae]RKF20784.1 COQ9 family protein [Altericroceibacterium spongiae]
MENLTLDEIRLQLAPAIADAAIFDGWTEEALMASADSLGVDRDVARIAFPGGAIDMIAAWIGFVDQRMAEECPEERMAALPIRERIRTLVQFRLDAVLGREEAIRRALAIQAMPQNVARSVKFGWHSADAMWRLAGDRATDYNYYTKRTILAGIYAATLAVFIEDESEGKVETRDFLDRRIAGVMKFEKVKAQWLKPRDHFSPVRFLGRLRYPAR